METNDLRLYGAKLLFQFRWELNGISNKRRICEERIIHIHASSPEDALKKAKQKGMEEEQEPYYIDDKKIYFEFIGILDLKEFGIELEMDEVWWEFYEMMNPMERKAQIIPDEEKLSVFEDSSNKKGRVRFPISSDLS